MKQAQIQDFIQDPDQRFILVYDFMRMWIFLIELIAYEKETPADPIMALAIGNAPTEQSRALLDENLFGDEELGNQATEDDEDEFGFQDFDDDYADDDLNDYNEYEY